MSVAKRRRLLQKSIPEEDDSDSDSNRLKTLETSLNLSFFGVQDFSSYTLKPDHQNRPIFVLQDGRIVLEAFSFLFEPAQDFLIAISEPISRPKLVHEYKLSEYSLYAAMSIGLKSKDIIDVLETLSKCFLPRQVSEFVEKHAGSFGKLKLVLRDRKYYLESSHHEIIRRLLEIPTISSLLTPNEPKETPTPPAIVFPQDGNKKDEQQIVDDHLFDPFFDDWIPDDIPESCESQTNVDKTPSEKDIIGDEIQSILQNVNTREDEDANYAIESFHVPKENVEELKRRLIDMGYPIVEEYDFKSDERNPSHKLELKASTKLRHYQEKSLNKMFVNGRGRSGIIVLPCGAGKTLVGVSAAMTVGKSCLVLCTSSVSVQQWFREFKYWSTAKESNIARFTADVKEKFIGESGILITTYTMLSFSGKRAHDAQKMMDFIKSKEWGFLLLDEVHVVPAEMFRKVLTIVPAHCKLGLTATLVREDEKIDALNYLIGPKMYEANWMDLAKQGHIANVQCAEVWCTVTPEFFQEYLHASHRKKSLLSIMNPRKIQACQYLIDFHEARGEKIIVFSDNVFALKHYASKLNKPYIYGGTSQVERLRVLQQFQYNPLLNTIFLSKIGDTSIDIPEATVLIQISSHYGSRRQEAQRLGRILRAKKRSDGDHNAFFYTLISQDTEEVYYSSKRQQFLVDQGYSFKIITKLEGIELVPDLVYKTLTEQLELLNTVLISNDMIDIEENDEELEAYTDSMVKKVSGSMKSLSGADNMAYMEFARGQFTSSGRGKGQRGTG